MLLLLEVLHILLCSTIRSLWDMEISATVACSLNRWLIWCLCFSLATYLLNLAVFQILVSHALKLPFSFVQLDSQINLDKPTSLSQISSKGRDTSDLRNEMENGVTSVKQMNTHGTIILYFCIMTVLMCCCLGRCLVVPIS